MNKLVLSPPKKGLSTLLYIAYGGRFTAELQIERWQGDPEILFKACWFILLPQAAASTKKLLWGQKIN